MEELNQIQENLETTKLKKKIKTSKEIKQELINKKKEIEKRLKEIELKEAEKRFKKINNLLIKNNNKFTDQDVQDFEEYILTCLEVKNEEKN
jgi:molybdopterin converting factor small subunit